MALLDLSYHKKGLGGRYLNMKFYEDNGALHSPLGLQDGVNECALS